MNSSSQDTKISSKEREQLAVKKDFIKAILIDFFFLALLIALYFFNRSYGFLEQFLSRFQG